MSSPLSHGSANRSSGGPHQKSAQNSLLGDGLLGNSILNCWYASPSVRHSGPMEWKYTDRGHFGDLFSLTLKLPEPPLSTSSSCGDTSITPAGPVQRHLYPPGPLAGSVAVPGPHLEVVALGGRQAADPHAGGRPERYLHRLVDVGTVLVVFDRPADAGRVPFQHHVVAAHLDGAQVLRLSRQVRRLALRGGAGAGSEGNGASAADRFRGAPTSSVAALAKTQPLSKTELPASVPTARRRYCHRAPGGSVSSVWVWGVFVAASAVLVVPSGSHSQV